MRSEIKEGRVKQPKTEGLEWLYLSMASFNGSGYADKSSPETYIKSYVAFKRMKHKLDAVELIYYNYATAYEFALKLIEANEPGHRPSEKNYSKFLTYYEAEGLL